MKLGFRSRRTIIAVSMMAAVLSFTWVALGPSNTGASCFPDVSELGRDHLFVRR
jgi:hypothetical protein